MSRNGSGTYSLPAGNPVVTGATISSTTHNNTMSDIATALTDSLAKDGQTTPTANLPMGGYRHTNVGDASARTDYAKVSQVQDGGYVSLSSVSGADTITAVCSPAISAYASGQSFKFVSAGANTGAVTLNINGLGAKSVTKEGTTALAAGDIAAGAVVWVDYDGTRFQLTSGRSTQPLDPTLTALAGLATGADQLPYSTGVDTFEQTPLTAFARTVLDDADADTAKATLEVGLQSRGHFSIATGLAMDASHLGKTAHYYNAADGSVTLPPIPASGKMVSFYVIGSGSLTINREGTTTGIYAKGAEGAASILIHKGESLTLVSDGTSWIQQAGGRAPSAPGAAPVFACRAWVNFNGTGTVAIRAAGNVSSITDNGAGSYVANLTVALLDTNYVAVGTCRGQSDGDANSTLVGVGVHSTGSVPIFTKNGSNALVDSSIVDVSIFR